MAGGIRSGVTYFGMSRASSGAAAASARPDAAQPAGISAAAPPVAPAASSRRLVTMPHLPIASDPRYENEIRGRPQDGQMADDTQKREHIAP